MNNLALKLRGSFVQIGSCSKYLLPRLERIFSFQFILTSLLKTRQARLRWYGHPLRMDEISDHRLRNYINVKYSIRQIYMLKAALS